MNSSKRNERQDLVSYEDEHENISLCIIGHHKLFRQALRTLLESTEFDVRYQGDDISEACDDLTDADEIFDPVDMVLFDMSMDSENILAELSNIRTRLPHTPVVVLNDSINMRSLEECLAAGVAGYLVKDISLEALLHSLSLVMLGEKIFPTNLADLLLTVKTHMPMQDIAAGEAHGISQREWQILHCLLDGDSNKRIALRLQITESTVKVHMKSLLRKIKVENRTQAALWALKHSRSATPMEYRPVVGCGQSKEGLWT